MAEKISPRPPASVQPSQAAPSEPVPFQLDVAGELGRQNQATKRSNDGERATEARLEGRRSSAQAGAQKEASLRGQDERAADAAAAKSASTALIGEVGTLPTSDGPALFGPKGVGSAEAALMELGGVSLAPSPLEGPILTALAALSLKAVDNLAHLFASDAPAGGQRVLLNTSPAPADQNAGREAVEITDLQVQAGGFAGGEGSWPYVAALALDQRMAQLMVGAPDLDPYALALQAVLGHEFASLQAGTSARALFAAASLANPPLGLPLVLQLRQADGAWQTFLVAGTQLGPDGTPSLDLQEVAGLLADPSQKPTNLPLDVVLARLRQLLVPSPGNMGQLSARHKEALSALGLTGCCLTSRGGATGPGQAIRASGAVRSQGGLLENRCLTCPTAQQLCLPQPG